MVGLTTARDESDSLPRCAVLTLCFAGDGDQDDAAGLEGGSGQPLHVAAGEEHWRSPILDLHHNSNKGLLHSRPVQSAAAVCLDVVQRLRVLLFSLLQCRTTTCAEES